VQQPVDGERTRRADEDCRERVRFERVGELRQRGQVKPLIDERRSELPAVRDPVLVQPFADRCLAVGALERVEPARPIASSRAGRSSDCSSCRPSGVRGGTSAPPCATSNRSIASRSCSEARRVAAAGLFNSCATPAASVPSVAIFSDWRSASSWLR
jgi:hypothetical protein